MKKYIVYTNGGFSLDCNGDEIYSNLLLDYIEANSENEALEQAEQLFYSGYYGFFDDHIVFIEEIVC